MTTAPELEAIELALRVHPDVDDCVVLERRTARGQNIVVAYVAGRRGLRPRRLEEHVRHTHPGAESPLCFMPVTHIPLTADGRTDVDRLLREPVVDELLAERWEQRLGELVSAGQVAAVVAEVDTTVRKIHLADVLPDWQRRSAAAAAPSRRGGRREETRRSALPAVSHGPVLETGPERARTLAEMLERAARLQPEHGTTYVQPDGSARVEAYPETLERGRRVMSGLRARGVVPGDKVILQLDGNEDFIAGLWGCVLGGFVPVPVSIAPTYRVGNAAVNKLHHTWKLLHGPVVLASSALLDVLDDLGDVLRFEGFRTFGVDDLLQSDPDAEHHPAEPDDLAVLLLTSGSTSLPKAVCQSHRALLAQSAGLAQTRNLTSADITLNWFPLEHVVGIAMCHLQALFACGQQVHAPPAYVLDDPLRWLDLIDRYTVTVTWSPNFAYGLVNARADEVASRRWDLSSVRFILNGGEAIVAKTARTFLKLLAPHGLAPTAMVPGWGMAETSSGVIFSDAFTLEQTSDDDVFVKLGKPVPGFSMRIVDDRGDIVREATVGRLQVRGAAVTSGYLANAEANDEAFTEDGWFNTGDLGRIENGSLTLTGREKGLIIVNGLNYHAHEIEKAAAEVPGVEVSYVAAFSVREPGSDTDALAIAFVPAAGTPRDLPLLIREIRQKVIQEVGVNPGYLLPLEREDIPKTEIGKIQHELLRSRFEAGEFDDRLKVVDLAISSSETLPGWFFTKVWRRKQAPSVQAAPPSSVLVLADEGGLGDGIVEWLEARGVPCARAVPAATYADDGQCDCGVDPASSRDLRHVLAAMAPFPEVVVHLWSYEPGTVFDPVTRKVDAAQRRSLHSLLALFHALGAERDAESGVQVVVASSLAQRVLPDEGGAPQLHPMIGLLKAARHEMPWLQCRHVDLQPCDQPAQVEAIMRELHNPSAECEIAYRDGARWIPRLRPVEFACQPARLPIRHGGTYLLSGGLGGIGSLVARRLLEDYGASLLLLGRTEIATDVGDTGEPHGDHRRERLAAYRKLEQLPGRVRYGAVDVADRAEVATFVGSTLAEWGHELDGIFHLAGVTGQQTVDKESIAGLAATMRAKVDGTLALYELIAERDDALFVIFSSVNGFFGGYAVGAYSAANAFLDAFSDWLAARGRPLGRSLCWTQWDEVGASRGFKLKEASRRRGYTSIAPRQGVSSLLAALPLRQPHVFIGLDGHNPHLRGLVESDDLALYALRTFVATADGSLPSLSGDELVVRDRFGLRVATVLEAMPEWASTDTGEIDRAALASRSAKKGHAELSGSARAELESLVASIWQEVMDLDDVDLGASFFDLGATSLEMSHVSAKLSEAVQRTIPLATLYEHPTVSLLASHLSGIDALAPGAVAENGRRGTAGPEPMRRRGSARAATRPPSGS